jgi:hypothetical protein
MCNVIHSTAKEQPDLRLINLTITEVIDYEHSYISPAALEHFRKFGSIKVNDVDKSNG